METYIFYSCYCSDWLIILAFTRLVAIYHIEIEISIFQPFWIYHFISLITIFVVIVVDLSHFDMGEGEIYRIRYISIYHILISKYTIFHPSAVNGGAAGALSLIAEHELKLLYKSACYILLQNACAMLKCL